MGTAEECHIARDKIAENLPNEIVTHIFQYLPLRDRLAAAQVCQRWHAVACDHRLSADEVVFFHDNLSQYLPVLQHSSRAFSHFVFKEMELGDKLLDFWDRFCPSLRSLRIQACNLSEKTLVDVLSRCPRLQRLQLSGCRELLMSGRVLESPEDVALLRDTLAELRELSLDSNRYLSDALFNRFAAIAPGLEGLSLAGCPVSFHVGLCKRFYPHTDARPLASESLLTFDNVLRFVAAHAGSVRRLDLGHTLLDNVALERLCRVPGLRLEALRACNCEQVNNAAVMALVEHQPGLARLDLSRCSRVTDHALLAVCARMHGLVSLNLRCCGGITNLGMAQLSRLVSLEELDLSQCRLLTGEGVARALCPAVNTRLRELRLTGLELDEATACLLAESLPALTLLDLGFCFNAVTDRSLQAICRHQRRLRTLVLAECNKVTDAGLTGMGVGEPSEPSQPAEPSEDVRVRLLSVRNGERLADPFHKISLRSKAEQEIVDDAKLKTLVSEVCEQQYVRTGDSLANLAGLRHLNLCGCNRITDVSLKHAFSFLELRHINLSKCHQVTVTGMRSLAANNPSIEELIMNNCYVSDEAMVSFVRHSPRLRHLELQHCEELTDAVLDALGESCGCLKHLDVSYCGKMSLEAAERLRARLPALSLVRAAALHVQMAGWDFHPPPPPLPLSGLRRLFRR